MSEKHLMKGSKLPPFSGKLRIYSMRFCPYAQRTHLVVSAKNIPHDVVNVNLKEKPEWLTSKSPLGKVPAIEIEEGVTIYESLITAEYIDEKYPQNPLSSKNPLRKAQDKLIIENFNKTITAYYQLIRNNESTSKDYFDGLEEVQKHLIKRKTPFLGGDTPGMVDYMIWPWFERFGLLTIYGGNSYAIDDNKFKFLNAWIERMQKDPAVKLWYLDTETHQKFFISYKNETPDYDFLL